MFDITKPFGKTIIENFNNGDLLYWTEWRVVDEKLTRFTHYGVLLRKESQFYGLREVHFGMMLCSETGEEIKILAIRLKKPETN